MFLSSISSVLRDNELFQEALPFVQALLSLIGKHTLQLFAGLVCKVLGEDRFRWEDKEDKPTFLRTGFVLGGVSPSLEDYSENE